MERREYYFLRDMQSPRKQVKVNGKKYQLLILIFLQFKHLNSVYSSLIRGVSHFIFVCLFFLSLQNYLEFTYLDGVLFMWNIII